MNNSKSFFNVILILGLVILIGVIYNYNNKKSTKDNMYSSENIDMEISGNSVSYGNVVGLVSNDGNNNYLPVSSLSANGNAASCNQQISNPSDLLPKDINSDWSNVNPANADLKNINLLSAGQLIGINTVGSSLRNPSLQERSEPIIPKTNIGPWNQSTIDADTLRRPLEIGTADL
jgi:hypothetical protein